MPQQNEKTEPVNSVSENSNIDDQPTPNRRPLVLEDEYGDPIIEGAYSGRDQLNIDALLPGRKEGEDEPAINETEDLVELEKVKKTQREATAKALIGIVIGATGLIWFSLNLLPKPQTSTTSSPLAQASVKHTGQVQAPTFAILMNAAFERYNSADKYGAQALFDQCVALVKTRDEAMQLVSFADRFAATNEPKLAELFYRKALAVLGLSAGPTSWEYLQSLTKLSQLCRGMQRNKEADDIDLYIARLIAQPKQQQAWAE